MSAMAPTGSSLTSSVDRLLLRPVAVSVFFVLLALLWTFGLQHVIAYPFVFLFFAAIMGSAWFGGAIAGSLAVVISSVLIAFFFIPPLYSFSIAHEYRTFQAAFVLCAIGIAIVSSARKRAENAIRTARDQLEVRVQERTAELQRSNEEILERERQLRTLTEAIPQQIWRTDAAGSIVYANGNLLDCTGTTSEALAGDGFDLILHPEDAPLFRQSWEQAVASTQPLEMQLRVRNAAGVYRWFLIRANPQRSMDGSVQGWYGVHIDIEEQQRAQRALVEAQDHLARLSRTLSLAEMAASIAHELNQPLTAVVSQAQACRRWLSMEPPNLERAVVTAEKMVRESTRASAVVSRVRALFSGDQSVREATDVNALIQELARLLRDEAIRRGVVLKLSLAPGLPRIDLDPIQVKQVVLNLAMNGMEAISGARGPQEIEISTQPGEAGTVVTTVRDTGPGIPEELRPRIFEPFFTTKPGGTGMGLAICRSIIEAHEGRIWIEPASPGVAFRFSLGPTP